MEIGTTTAVVAASAIAAVATGLSDTHINTNDSAYIEVNPAEYSLTSGGIYAGGDLVGQVPAWLVAAIDREITTGEGNITGVVDDLRTLMYNIDAGVTQSIGSINTALDSTNSLLTSVNSKVDNNQAYVVELESTTATKEYAKAAASDHVTSVFGPDAIATVDSIASTYTDANSAIAQDLDAVRVDLGSTTVQVTSNTFATATLRADVTTLVSETDAAILALQSQLDGSSTSYFIALALAADEVPVVTIIPDTYPDDTTWDTEAAQLNHVGDLLYDTDSGHAYRFIWADDGTGIVFSWIVVTDTDATLALQIASDAQDTADGKRTVFTQKPDTTVQGYDVGDLWLVGTDYVPTLVPAITAGEILRCATAIATSSTDVYDDSHWILASKYTDDSYAKDIESGIIAIDLSDNVQALGWDTAIAANATTWYDTVPPTLTLFDEGDIWVDTSNNDYTMLWNGEEWVDTTGATDIALDNYLVNVYSVDKLAIAEQLDGVAVSYFQETAPYTVSDGVISSNSDTWMVTADTSAVLSIVEEFSITGELLTTTDYQTTLVYKDELYKFIYTAVYWDNSTTVKSITREWLQVTDQVIVDSFIEAAKTKAAADRSTQNFTAEPITPYYLGDTWMEGPTGDIYVCMADSRLDSFSTGDWLVASSTAEDLYNYTVVTNNAMEEFTVQLDQKIEAFYYNVPPSDTVAPTDQWIAEGTQSKHLFDTYYDMSANRLYRYTIDYIWEEILDANAIAAYELASTANETADGKTTMWYDEAGTNWEPSTTLNDGSIEYAKYGDTLISGTNHVMYRAKIDWPKVDTDWLDIRDLTNEGPIADALAGLANLQEARDGLVTTFYDTSPTTVTGMSYGDYLVITTPITDGVYTRYEIYRYETDNGTDGALDTPVNDNTWHVNTGEVAEVLSQGYNAQATADGKIRTFYQSAEPVLTDDDIGDIWINTANNNTSKVWAGINTGWVDTSTTEGAQALEWAAGASKLLTNPDTGGLTGWSFQDGSIGTDPDGNTESGSTFDIHADTFRLIGSNGTPDNSPFTVEVDPNDASKAVTQFNGVVNFSNGATDMSDYDNSNVDLSALALSDMSNVTTIDGGKITTGTIDASKINTTDLFAQDILATGTITGGTMLTPNGYGYASIQFFQSHTVTTAVYAGTTDTSVLTMDMVAPNSPTTSYRRVGIGSFVEIAGSIRSNRDIYDPSSSTNPLIRRSSSITAIAILVFTPAGTPITVGLTVGGSVLYSVDVIEGGEMGMLGPTTSIGIGVFYTDGNIFVESAITGMYGILGNTTLTGDVAITIKDSAGGTQIYGPDVVFKTFT